MRNKHPAKKLFKRQKIIIVRRKKEKEKKVGLHMHGNRCLCHGIPRLTGWMS